MIKRFSTLFLLLTSAALGQSNRGELRLRVADETGVGVKATVQIVSEGNQFDRTLVTDEQGSLTVSRLPYGLYRVEVRQSGFANATDWIEIRSSIPTDRTVQLRLSGVSEVGERDGKQYADQSWPGGSRATDGFGLYLQPGSARFPAGRYKS